MYIHDCVNLKNKGFWFNNLNTKKQNVTGLEQEQSLCAICIVNHLVLTLTVLFTVQKLSLHYHLSVDDF